MKIKMKRVDYILIIVIKIKTGIIRKTKIIISILWIIKKIIRRRRKVKNYIKINIKLKNVIRIEKNLIIERKIIIILKIKVKIINRKTLKNENIFFKEKQKSLN